MFHAPRIPVAFLLLSAWPASVLAAPPPRSVAVRASTLIELDGQLTEAAWQSAPAASGLTQWEPQRGQPARLDVSVRVLFDGDSLYVGALLPKPRSVGRVVGHLHRRDQWSASDWFEVDFDTMHDHFTAYQFYVNAANVQMDVLLMGPDGDRAWDAAWASAVHVGEDGWSVEMRLPLSIFHLPRSPGAPTWGFSFGRQEPLTREISTWTVPAREVRNTVSVFGHLDGVDVVGSGVRREWLPYASSAAELQTSQASYDRRRSHRVGLDARFGFRAGELNVTLLPDFGQVEVDQSVLNLSTTETFLPEKRPFFTQGMEVFNNTLGPWVFYSRRIGKAIGPPEVEGGERVVDRPLASEVLGAAKFIGRFAGGRTVGLLGAVTGAASARTADAEGNQREQVLAPRAEYGAASVIQPVGTSGGRLLGMVTFANESGSTGRRAAVAAVELTQRSRSGRFTLELFGAGSRAGPKNASTPTGSMEAARVNVGLGAGLVARATAWNVTPTFDIRDVGYIDRSDQRGGEVTLQRNGDRTRGILRNWGIQARFSPRTDSAGKAFHRRATIVVDAELTSQWRGRVSAEHSMSIDDDRELRTFADTRKKYLHVPAWDWISLDVGTPYHWWWSVDASVAAAQRPDGASRDLSLLQTVRPSSRWQVNLETRYTDQDGYLGFVSAAPGPAPLPGQAPGIPIVGIRRLRQFEQVLRVGFTYSTTLSVQGFLQGLAGAWSFRDLRYYGVDTTLVPGLPVGAAPPQTIFGSRQVNLNALLRWEFKAGSTAYLVFTRGVADNRAFSESGAIRPFADLAGLRGRASDDVIQVKVSWLLR